MKFLLCVLFLLSASVASAQCPPGGCRVPQGVRYQGLFRRIDAPAGSTVIVTHRRLFRWDARISAGVQR